MDWMCWIRAVPDWLLCFQLRLVAAFSPACQKLPACCIRVFPGSACQLLSPQLLWLSHCPVPFSLGHRTAFSSVERSCGCRFVSALSPNAFVRAFKNLLRWICASATLENKLLAVFFFHSVSSKVKFWELSAE